MRKRMCLVRSGLALLAGGVPAATTAAVYDGSVIPSAASPAWGYVGSTETADYSVSGGILSLNQPAAAGGAGSWYYIQQAGLVGPGDGVEGTGDFYLEARFKLDANATQANNFYDTVIGILQNRTGTLYSDEAIYVADAGGGALNINYRRQGTTIGTIGSNDDAYHTYRVEYDQDSSSASQLASRVLVDGTEVIGWGTVPIVNFGSSFGDRVLFGDNGGGGPITGFHWDYVDYGAVPEPEVVVFGALLVMMGRRRTGPR